MKNPIRLAVFFALCIFALPTLAQERVIEKKEFDETYSAALKKVEKKVNRSTYDSESTWPGYPTFNHRTSSVTETVPPDREHDTTTYARGDTSNKYESIRIGKNYWSRVNDGVWKLNNGFGSGSGSGSGIAAREIERKIEYSKIVGEFRDGVTVDHYQYRQTIRWESARGVFDEVTRTDYWIRKDGLPVRYETKTNDALRDRVEKVTITWEYPARIVIEAPDIYEGSEKIAQ